MQRWQAPLLAACLVLVAFAGCIQQNTPEETASATTTPAPDGANATEESDPGVNVTRSYDPNMTGEFCKSEAGCKFYDDLYHEYVLYEVDTAEFDVLIVPAAAPAALAQTAAMKQAVVAWGEGVKAFGAPWFRDNFTLNVYVLGQDTPPASAIQDPEIIVLGAEYNPVLLFGIGLEPAQFACMIVGQDSLRDYPVHSHDGIEVRASNCVGTGFTCVALNTNFLGGGLIRMQDLVAHEVGHCLGIGHVGDALDFRAKAVPIQDIMSYQHNPDQVHCVSNMNVRVLEDVYASVLGKPEFDLLKAGDYYTFDPAEYRHVLCENP